MKTKLALICLLALISSGCGDDSSPKKELPDANAEFDTSGKGIYKGLVVGSSGTIKFNIANDGTYSATLIIDDVTYELTTEGVYNSGFEAYFYGTMNTANDISVGFTSNSDGSSFGTFGIVIPGHTNVSIEVYKELSDALVRVFEGTYIGDATGVFNLMTVGDDWFVVSQTTEGNEEFYGFFEENELVCDNCSGTLVTGLIEGNVASGEWSNYIEEVSGTWSGVRTL